MSMFKYSLKKDRKDYIDLILIHGILIPIILAGIYVWFGSRIGRTFDVYSILGLPCLLVLFQLSLNLVMFAKKQIKRYFAAKNKLEETHPMDLQDYLFVLKMEQKYSSTNTRI